MSFVRKLREYRENMELTQDELGEKINRSQKTISSWETGRSEPTIGEFISLCNLFGCTLADLSCTKEREIGDITIEDIIVKLQSLDYDKTKMLYEKIKLLLDVKREQELLKKERDQMKMEKDLMLKRLQEYQDKISLLERRIKDAES